MKKIIIISLSLVLIMSLTACGKNNIEKLPNLETIVEMDEGDVNSILPVYTIDQLKEAWGTPNDSGEQTDVWYFDDMRLIVNSNWFGKVVVCGLEKVDTDEPSADRTSAHLYIDKAKIVDIVSKNSIVVEIMNEVEHEKDEYSLSNREIISVIFSEDNQRAIDLISKLQAGSIINISRYDTTKPQTAMPYRILECIGIDIFDDNGDTIVEYF